MLERIRYLQAIVRCGSFTEAAAECNVSQSAISQQIVSLENELGIRIFDRSKRRIRLTPSGEYFYRKSLVIVEEYDRLVRETRLMENTEKSTLRIGYHITYGGEELQKAIAEMSKRYPDLKISVISGNHESLYHLLNTEKLDIILSDQRKVFSNRAHNRILQCNPCYVEIARANPVSELPYVEAEDLRNIPCIAVAVNSEEQENEQKYLQTTYGIESSFLFAPSIKDGRLLVVAGRGYLPVDGTPILSHFDQTIRRVPLMFGGQPVQKNLCLFWLKDNSGYYIEEFAEILEEKFRQSE